LQQKLLFVLFSPFQFFFSPFLSFFEALKQD
jgi:hypothetical protein